MKKGIFKKISKLFADTVCKCIFVDFALTAICTGRHFATLTCDIDRIMTNEFQCTIYVTQYLSLGSCGSRTKHKLNKHTECKLP